MITIEVCNDNKWERVPLAYDIDRETGHEICKRLSDGSFPNYEYRLLEDGTVIKEYESEARIT